MSGRRLKQIETEIERLKKEAERIRAEEVSGVIERIREAIAHYGLETKDLFGKRTKVASPRKARGAGKRSAGRKRAGVGSVPVKFRDGQGNTWTGRGLKPRWLSQAIAEGKTLQDFAV